jgi:hypothetical protein
MKAAYKVTKECNEFVVVNKAGLILAYFGDRKDLAAEYVVAQNRADEQSAVMADYNAQQELRALVAELRAEFA